MATSGATVWLKLLIDTKSKRVLFAEAGDDFVTFLYNLLSLSSGTVFKLLNKRPILNIPRYDGIENDQRLSRFKSEISISDPNSVYMVMDDLTVKPMSNVSGITLLNDFTGKAVGPLEERVVHLGLDEGLKLLKATLQTNMVLTSIFLGGTGTNDA